MRITYLNSSGQMGGAETSLLELLASVKAAQPDWPLDLVLGEDGPFAVKVRALGVPVHVIPFPRALAGLGDSDLAGRAAGHLARISRLFAALVQTAQYTRQLAKTIRDLKPDLIHSTGFKMHVLALWARAKGNPVIWHIHDYVSCRPVMRRMLRWHAGGCAAIIANSAAVRADVMHACPQANNVVLVYNAVDLKRFSPCGSAMDLDAAAGFPATAEPVVRAGLLATFAKWKGHQVFLKALSLLPANLPLRGYIIGGPIYQTQGSQYTLEELREEVRKLGLEERVGFTCFVDAPESAMRALDIVVHASTQPEPFGMAIVEAMACGSAVIATSSSGAAELFSNGRDVLEYPCGNAEELAQRIQSLFADPELRQRLGKAGRRSVEIVLQPPRLAAELEATYRRVILRGSAL